MMEAMKYFAPKTMQELSAALAELTPKSKLLGGGTDLIIRLNSGGCEPDALLYMGFLPDIDRIMAAGAKLDTIEIGAMATMTSIAESKLLTGSLAAIADAARDVGCKQIRNNGTIGGNIGNASAAGDMLPVLFMLNADVEIMSAKGELRREPISKVVVGPMKTTLAFNDAIVKFIVKLPSGQTSRSAFSKLGFRKALTISRIGLAVTLERDNDGVITSAEVVAGAISLTPVHVKAAEEYLPGKKLGHDAYNAVGKALSDLIMEITPEMFDRDYKAGAAFGVAEDVLKKFD